MATMQVEMEDGFIVKNVPENATKKQVDVLYGQQKTKQIEDIPKEVKGLDYAKGLARSGVEGMTLGFGDEIGMGIAALPASLMTGEGYTDVYGKMRKTYNQQQQEFERQNPKTALAANVAGGLMTGGMIGGRLLGSAKALANPMRTAAKTGAIMGGISGAGYAPTMEDVPTYASVGTLAGGAIPPALMMGGKAISPALSTVKNLFTTPHPSETAGRVVGQYIKQDAQTANQIRKSMIDKGQESVLADVGGANIRGMAQAAAQHAGKVKDDIGKMFGERQSGSLNRLMGSIKKMSGGDTEYFDNMKKIVTRRREQAAPLYKEASTMNIDGNEAQAMVNSVKQLGNEFEPAARYIKKFVKKNSDGAWMPKMSMKELHSLQRELRDDINKAYRSGSGELGGALSKMRDKLLESMDKVGQYRQARSIYAGESSVINSMKLGKNILKDDFDEMAYSVGKMSQSEKEGFINGALKTVRDKLMTGKEDKNAATKLSSQLVRERLRNVFPDDETYKKFIGQLDIEDDFARTYQSIYGGSQTQPRGVAEKELTSIVHGGKGLEGNDLFSTASSAIKAVTGKGEMPAGVIEEIQRLSFTPIGKLTPKDWKLLRKYSINKPKLEKIKQAMPVAPSVAVVGSTQDKIAR